MIYTFYSFKGGVGRSMGLASIANVFAERGLRVLAIDFDLEAPGLERFYFGADEARAVRGRQGLLDLILTYKLALTSEIEFKRAAFRNWQDFVSDVIPATTGGGSVCLMTAGRREPEEALRNYALEVRTFDWQDFMVHWNGAQFFAWLRDQLTDAARGYDVVLVDSRTGVTEMGGVCAYQLADAVVMLCAANYQNLDGTLSVVRDFRSTAVLALRGGRPLEILVVPARLEGSHPDRERFLDDFEQALTTEGLPRVLAMAGLDYRRLALPYDPAYALGDRWVGEVMKSPVETRQDFRAVFERLADALTLLATSGRLAAQHPAVLDRLRSGSVPQIAVPIADVTHRGAGVEVFLDYAAEDHEVASALKEQLQLLGHTIFSSDANALGPDGDFDLWLSNALAYSDILVLLIGRGSPSPWRDALIRKARERGSPAILPVLLDKDVPPTLLSSYGLDATQAVVLDGAAPTRLSDAATTIAGRLGQRRSESRGIVDDAHPYPGPRPFAEDDQPHFFGRDVDIVRIEAGIRSHDVVVITGPSGVGKTSLIRAGVVPRLRADATAGNWQIDVFDLGAEHDGHLLETRLADFEAEGTSRRLLALDGVDSFPDDGSQDARRNRYALVARAARAASTTRKLLLCGRGTWDAEDEAVIRGAIPSHRGLAHEVLPLDRSALGSAVRSPAERHRHLFEPGLIDRLVDDAGEAPSAVALLQLALPALWNQRRRGWLTNHAYNALGGITGLMRGRRDVVLQSLSPEDRKRSTVLLSNLVLLDPALTLVPAPGHWQSLQSIPALQPDPLGLRDRLAAERLIVVRRLEPVDPASAATAANVECALSLKDATAYLAPNDIAPELMLWRQRFRTYVLFWTNQRDNPDALVRGDTLAVAQSWLGERSQELSADERSLIVASGEREAERRRAETERQALERIREQSRDEETRREEHRRKEHRQLDTRDQIHDATGNLRSRCQVMLERLGAGGSQADLAEARRLLVQLRNAREFETMGLLAEAVSRQFPDDITTGRLYGQYFIDTGKASAASHLLKSVANHVDPGHPEFAEISGLLGRSYKQIFLDAGERSSHGARDALQQAIAAYRVPFERSRSSWWHGINLVSLLMWARKLDVKVQPPLDGEEIARELVRLLENTPVERRDEWFYPTLAEAYLGMGDWDEVERCIRTFAAAPDTAAFQIASTIRQLTQVWGMDQVDAPERGRTLVDILRARLIQLPGGEVEVGREATARAQPQPMPADGQLERILGVEGPKTYRWWQAGVKSAGAVASIRSRNGHRAGTGFLTRAGDLGLSPHDELVVLTCSHVVNVADQAGTFHALTPDNAEIVFEAADLQATYQVEDILWTSPPDRHDVSILRVSPAITGIEPLSIASALPVVAEGARVYIIGHPGYSDLAFSLQDNELLDHEGSPHGRPSIPGVVRVHYRAPTEGGSSGSPVFNSTSWQVIAIHHKGGTSLPRLNGVAGTYAANEGIALQSIVEAIGRRS